MALSREDLLEAYRRMKTIREVEERVHVEFAKGGIPGFVHLYAGEEASAAGVCMNLTDEDKIASTHRGHGHCIGKGVDVHGMMAEIYGKRTGTCRGKGGSMHIADLDTGMLGANGIVGGGLGLAVGAGLTAKLRKTGGVSVAFFGDGASNQGQFHEAMNLAAIWKLPVIFVCENNGYGEATPMEFVTSVVDIAERARGYAMNAVIADGMDFFDVYEKAGLAIARARAGHGPTLLECKTYRFMGHYVGDNMAYRSKQEMESWKQRRDPLELFESHVREADLVDAESLRAVDGDVARLLEESVAFAEASPFPTLEQVTTDVYVRER